MLELSQIKLPCGSDAGMLETKIRKQLRLAKEQPLTYTITHHSVDARKKPILWDVYSVCLSLSSEQEEQRVLKKSGKALPNLRVHKEIRYQFPSPNPDATNLPQRPVIVGFGPAGIFCALELARAGYRPIVLERGQRMEERMQSVERFWNGGTLNPESNIQFGEGGAGTFSDGKLTSNVSDKAGRVREVIETFLAAGAPEDIAYEQIPHIGTDRLRVVIQRLREEIEKLGGEIYFDTCVTGLCIQDGAVAGASIRQKEGSPAPTKIKGGILPASVVVLAPGHSARDTIRMLHELGVPMEAKNFAVGFRVSHPQEMINLSQYGIADAAELERLHLAPVSYKLTARAEDGHGVYSFCMCPGGYVVNASSEPKRLAVNGMSDYKRDAARANSAIVMTIGPEDYGDENVLDGLQFQEQLEERAYTLSGGSIPVERFPAFERQETDTSIPSSEELCIKGASSPAPLHELLPEQLTCDFIEGMHQFGRRIQGFDGEECYVIGLESRTSSPVRIPRGEDGQSAVKGLYPCGEGAGYAGGIMSAAVDGIRTAEQIGRRYQSLR